MYMSLLKSCILRSLFKFNMAVHFFKHMFSFLFLGIVSVSAALITSPALVLPNCRNKCGNVTIPYPFGIGSSCYRDKWFSITCNTSVFPHKPFLTHHRGTEVLDIQLPESTMRIYNPISSSCLLSISTTSSIDFEDNPYLFYSEKSNRFSAFGCGVKATISTGNNEFIGGCISICSDDYMRRNQSTTSGYGFDCCQAMIPHGLKNFSLNVSGTTDYNESCKYAFLVEQVWFLKQSFSVSSIMPLQVPVVLDWKFSANETCKICGPNAICSMNQSFVSCSCAKGYDGNPYLPQGCTDVDECANQRLNLCVKRCINLPGNYSCACPSGFHGDGTRNGIGCIENRPWLVQALIGTGTSTGFLFSVLGVYWFYKVVQRRKIIKLKQKFFERNGGLLLKQKLSTNNESNVEKTKLFTSSELEVATDNYNENRILGRGGQGTVYKGMLTDGRIVAVKKSEVIDDDETQLQQFINEVVILSEIDHRNVLKLLGCCLETEVPLLVYEFIPNGTLSSVIHDQTEEFPLSWEMRLRVASEVASAISYLHSAASVPIFHRDIKSTNILLDEKFRAKVSDFGTSRSVSLDQTHLTTQVKGTFGYFDPEYFNSTHFTEKSDVYSFGVVLVELLTGKTPIFSIGSEAIGLASYFIESLEENHLFDILDARVAKEDRKEELIAVAHLAERCLHNNGRNRPCMKQVAMELEGIVMSKGSYLSIIEPKQVSFYLQNSVEIWKSSSTDGNTIHPIDVQPLI